MTAISTIERVLASDLLSPTLCFVPSTGASAGQLEELERAVARSLSPQHRALLDRWNGLDLEVVRLLGTGLAEKSFPIVETYLEMAREIADGAIPVANDPSGFLYVELPDGGIVAWDHDGGEVERIAGSLDEFFSRVVFGPESARFLGEDWLTQLKTAGVV